MKIRTRNSVKEQQKPPEARAGQRLIENEAMETGQVGLEYRVRASKRLGRRQRHWGQVWWCGVRVRV